MLDPVIDTVQNRLDFLGRNLLVFSISSGIWGFASNLVAPFFALYVLELGGNYVSIGLIGLTGGLSIVPSLVGGYLADTMSRKKIVSVLSICLGPINLINAFATHWTFLLVSSSISSIFYGLRGPAFSAILADSLNPEERGKGYGFWSSIPDIPAIISPTIGGLLIANMGRINAIRLGYIIVAIAATFAGILRYLFLEETYKGQESSQSLKESIKAIGHTAKKLPPSLKILILISIIVTFGYNVKSRYKVIYATTIIGLSELQWGILNTVVRLGRSCLLPFLGSSVDRIGRKEILFISNIFIAIVDFLFVCAFGFYTALLALSIRSLAGGLRGTSRSALRADLSPRETRGKISSIFRVATRPARMIAPFIGGFIYTIASSSPFLLEASLSVLLLPMIYFYLHEPKEKEL